MTGEDDDMFAPSPASSGYEPPPLAFLPTVLARLLEDCAERTFVDPGRVIVPALIAASGAIGARTILRLSGTWEERASLWIATVAPAGAGKTPPARPALAPVQEIAARMAAAHRERIERWEADFAAWKGLERKMQKQTPPPARPAPQRVDTVNFTTEALFRVLAENDRGLMCWQDELIGLLGGFDRYAKNGAGADEAILCSIWSNVSTIIDRKGEPDPLRIECPYLALGGNVTMKGLRALASRAESGLYSRFLIVRAPTPSQPVEWRPSQEPPRSYVDWRERILRVRDANEELRVLRMDQAAENVWAGWFEAHHVRLRALPEESPIRWVLAKMPSQAARLALVLHCLELGGSTLSERTMRWALGLADWFAREGERILLRLAGEPDADLLREFHAWLCKQPGPVDARAWLANGPRPRPRTADDARKLMAAMVAAGLAKWDPDKPRCIVPC